MERREKVLMEELEQIELQAGLGKQPSNETYTASSVREEPPTLMEEGEENRDPNHEVKSIKTDEVSLPISTCETQEIIEPPIDTIMAEAPEKQEMLEDANNG